MKQSRCCCNQANSYVIRTVACKQWCKLLNLVSPFRPICEDQGEYGMIARHWRGWTRLGDADNYERLLKDVVLPQLKQIPGYLGGYVLRRQRMRRLDSNADHRQ